MPLSHIFGTLTSWQAAWLDDNFAELGACSAIPCTVSGTNSLLLTPIGHTPDPSAYANLRIWSGIAAATNTSAATANINPLGVRSIYKDTGAGPVALSGGEIIIGTYFLLAYDSALNGGVGGFHLLTAPATAVGTITGVTAGTGLAGGGSSGGVTLSFDPIADSRILANLSGGVAAPIANTLSAILDLLSTTRGAVVYRGAAAWAALAPGTQGQYLYTPGSGADPSWKGGIATAISAAGTTQGTATLLTATYNQIGTVGAGTGVILDTILGKPQWLWNDGANTLNVYPPSGAQIDNAGTNTPVTVAANAKAAYVMVSATQAKSLI